MYVTLGGVLYLQISLALRESTERSLVILDEFGKGTATVSCSIHNTEASSHVHTYTNTHTCTYAHAHTVQLAI